METSHQDEIANIVDEVRAWPHKDRLTLAHLILRGIHAQTRGPAPRHTVDRALGIAKGTLPPPDDAAVRTWIDEHRMKKYG